MAAFCGACGSAVRGGAAFCGSCGAEVVASSSTVGSVGAVPGVDRVDRFRVEAVLGRGRAGVLFRAFDPDLGRLVAVRQLDAAVTGDPVRFAAVRDAVARMAGIADPHCVEVFSLIADEAPPLMVSEFVDGVSAQALVAQQGKLSPAAALLVLDGALAGLGHIHSLGLVHGFLTPSCVLVDPTGSSKITDVGLGYEAPVPADVGLFLAPEVLAGLGGDGQAGVAADVFGASAVLWLLTTGRAPIRVGAAGGAGAAGGLLGVAGLPVPVGELIASGLAVDPAGRPGSVAVFRARLEAAAVASCGPDWRKVGAGALAAAAVATVAVVAVPTAIGVATSLFAAGKAAALGGVVLGKAAAVGVGAGGAGVAGVGGGAGAAAAGTGAGVAGAAAGTAAAGTGGTAATSGGVMAAIASKPLIVGAVAAGAVAAGGTAAYVVAHDRGAPLTAPVAIGWGGNGFGQLGDGTTLNNAAPQPVTASGLLAGKTIKTIATGWSGGAHQESGTACAIDVDGAAYCWGEGSGGQLGDGTRAARAPVRVSVSSLPVGRTFASIDVGTDNVCALDSDGAAYCWGNNEYGQLGNGATGAAASQPVAVASAAFGSRRLTSIGVGAYFACALSDDGVVFCWGRNAEPDAGLGALGRSSPAPFNSPQPIDAASLDSPVAQLAVGENSACVVTRAGSGYCWGGEDSPLPAPTATGSLAGVQLKAISGAAGDPCALDIEGVVHCLAGIGENQLDDVSWRRWSTGALAGRQAVAISGGSARGCAIDVDGGIACWGWGTDGQLGNGEYTSSQTPTAVGFGSLLEGAEVEAIDVGTTSTFVVARVNPTVWPEPAFTPARLDGMLDVANQLLPAVPGSSCMRQPHQLVNGKATFGSGLSTQKVAIVDPVLYGRLTAAGPPLAVALVRCAGEGSEFALLDLVVLDSTGAPVAMSPGNPTAATISAIAAASSGSTAAHDVEVTVALDDATFKVQSVDGNPMMSSTARIYGPESDPRSEAVGWSLAPNPNGGVFVSVRLSRSSRD